MAGETFSSLSSNEARRFGDERVEPDLGPRSTPRSITQERKLTLVLEASARAVNIMRFELDPENETVG
jgi:hypothetical protein